MFAKSWKIRTILNWSFAGAPLIAGQIAIFYLKDTSYILPIIVFSVILGLVMSIRFLHILDFYVLGGLRYVTKQLDKIADEADISAKFEQKSDDEVGHLVRALGRAFSTFRSIISAAQESSNKVTSASSNLTLNTQQLQSISEQVANAISQVSQGITEQSRSAAHVSKLMHEMTESIHSIAKGANTQATEIEDNVNIIKELSSSVSNAAEIAKSVEKLALESADAARSGKDIVDRTVNGMELIHETVISTGDKIQSLGQSSQKIGEIIAVIEDIADQTNLLALNAAIEAARAGEQGKGFAVVADEVRKLAERSTMATKEIAELIDEIQQGTATAVDAMKDGTIKVREGMGSAEGAGLSLQEIYNLINEVSDKISLVSESSSNMVKKSKTVEVSMDKIYQITTENKEQSNNLEMKSEDVLKETENIAAVTEQSAASSEEVAASAQEQSATAQELTASVEMLSEIAKKLHKQVERFKTGESQTEKISKSYLQPALSQNEILDDKKIISIKR